MGSNQGASVVPATYSQRVIAAVNEAIEASGISEAEIALRASGAITRTTLRRRRAGSSFYTDELEAIAAALDVEPERFGAPGRVS